jgi:hypothetical protein
LNPHIGSESTTCRRYIITAKCGIAPGGGGIIWSLVAINISAGTARTYCNHCGAIRYYMAEIEGNSTAYPAARTSKYSA